MRKGNGMQDDMGIEVMNFENVKDELEVLEGKVKWGNRFRNFCSGLFLIAFFFFILLMPISVGVSVLSLGTSFMGNPELIHAVSIIATALSSFMISIVIGLGQIETVGLTSFVMVPILFISNLRLILLQIFPM